MRIFRHHKPVPRFWTVDFPSAITVYRHYDYYYTLILHHYVSTVDYGGVPLTVSIVFDVSRNVKTWRR